MEAEKLIAPWSKIGGKSEIISEHWGEIVEAIVWGDSGKTKNNEIHRLER